MINYIVNAWLDKRQPELELVEQESGHVVRRWQGRRLQELFNSGLITYQELATNSQEQLKALVKALILEVTCEELCGRCLYQS
jgi:hypothetical protein